MTKFIFDLDGTITKDETLLMVAEHFGVKKEIDELNERTTMGNIPYMEAFIRRAYILGKIPATQIDEFVGKMTIYPMVQEFIREHKNECTIVTGNLRCWVNSLVEKIGCVCYCSDALMENDKLVKLTSILKKENVVQRYKAEGDKVVFIGDGNNDVEAMRVSDVSIASGLTHMPAAGVLSVANYLVLNEEGLCRQLNQLL